MAAGYEPRAYDATPVPDRTELHVLNRLGCGFSASSLADLRAAGGAMPWFEQQLFAHLVEESPLVAAIDSWFPFRADSLLTRYENSQAGRRFPWQYASDFVNWTTLRRAYSRRSVLETMVDFWSHHFHVPAMDDQAWIARDALDTTVRAHALGRFDEMLPAVTLSPAMLIYLDNFRSMMGDPNENHGRELLELHTVGRDAGFTEAMVRDSAIILSGWTMTKQTWVRRYDETRHTLGPVEVLGFTAANDSPDGRSMTGNYLRHLAHHPATARHLARKLVTRFVGDHATDSLVTEVATAYLQSGTRIPATLRVLVNSAEFQASYAAKVRPPVDDLVATIRALDIAATKPTSGSSFANQLVHVHGCDPLYMWPRPDGAPQSDAHWCTAGRMLGSFRMHWNLAGGLEPTLDAVFRKPASWLPQGSIEFDLFVDHVSRVLLGRSVTSVLLQAACEATGLTPATVVNKDHPLVRDGLAPLLAALLDSPEHMRR